MFQGVILHAVLYIRKFLENAQGTLQSKMPGSNSETQGRLCDGLSSTIMVQYSAGHITTFRGRITAREYVNRLGDQAHPIIQALFPNNDAVFQVNNAPINTAETVQS
jgi:hypothetical protein